MKAHRFLFPIAALLGLSPLARGQLFIDAAGPRNLLFSEKARAVPLSNRLDLKFDTEAKSLTAAFLSLRTTDSQGVDTRGFLVKAAGVNSWEDLLKHNTAIEGTLLWNYTNAPKRSLSSGEPVRWIDGPWFVNVSGSFQHAKLRLRPTATSPVRDENSDTGRVTLGTGRQFGYGNNGIALTAGFARDTNYKRLTKVTVDGRDAREGTLRTYDTYPVSLVLTQRLPGELVDDIVKAIPGIDPSTEKGTHGAVVAAYGTFRAIQGSADTRTFGLNFTLTKKLIAADKDIAAAKAAAAKLGATNIDPAHLRRVTYPLSVFVEWEKPNGGKTDRKAGMAVLFSWP